MRIRIDFYLDDCFGKRHNLAIATWIYKILGQGSRKYSAFLHDTGYSWYEKPYRGFTFSPLEDNNGEYLSLTVSSPLCVFWKHFIAGLLQATDAFPQIIKFEILEKAVYTTNGQYILLAPICVRERREYCLPGQQNISKIEGLIKGGLINKMCAFRDLDLVCEIENKTCSDFKICLDVDYMLACLAKNKPIISQHQIHGHQAYGFSCPVKIEAGYHLRKYIALLGIGCRTSLGFGYLTPRSLQKNKIKGKNNEVAANI